MTSFAYAGFIWKSHRGLVLFSGLMVGLLQFLIVWLIASIDFAPIVTSILQQFPPPMQAIFNDMFLSRLSTAGAIAFGFNHPVTLAMLALVAILIPTRHISGEIENGTLELLLAYPIHRTRLIGWLWLNSTLLLLVVVVGAWVGTFLAVIIYDTLTLDLSLKVMKVGLNLWLLFILTLSYSLLFSVFSRMGRKSGIYSAGLTLVLYFLHFLTTIWEEIAFLKPCNIFEYYQPQKLMFDQRSFLVHATVLISTSIFCLLLSLIQFNRRDISG